MQVDRSGRVWAMRPDPMGVAAATERREKDREGNADTSAGRGELLDGSDFARLVDGVAVIPVMGMLMNRMSFWFWSYEEIRRDIELALDDDRVERILLDIDSPGGLVAGCSDLAAFIRIARERKPIVAWCGGLCASAAFMIGGSASELMLGSGAVVGSVGVVIEYMDLEPYFEKLGARVVRVVAEQSPNKRLDPESEEGRAEMQALVDAGAEEFIEALAEGRGVPVERVRADFGQGLVFKDKEAIRRNMADGMATFSEILAELAGREGEFGAAPAAAGDEEKPMDWASITSAGLREHRPELVEEIEQAAADAAQADDREAIATEAREAERARILGIEEVAIAGHEDLVAAAKAGDTTPEQLAVQIVKASKAAGKDHLAARADADRAIGDIPAAPPPAAAAADETAPIEDRAKAEWAADAKIRSEFTNEAAYVAFRKAEDRGATRIYKRAS